MAHSNIAGLLAHTSLSNTSRLALLDLLTFLAVISSFFLFCPSQKDLLPIYKEKCYLVSLMATERISREGWWDKIFFFGFFTNTTLVMKFWFEKNNSLCCVILFVIKRTLHRAVERDKITTYLIIIDLNTNCLIILKPSLTNTK